MPATQAPMPAEALYEALVLKRGNLKDPYSEDAWSTIRAEPMDRSRALKLLKKVQNISVDVTAKLSKVKCGGARYQIKEALKERQTFEGQGSGYTWIVALVEANLKHKTVPSERSAYQENMLTYPVSIDVILVRVPLGPSPYAAFQIPQGGQPAGSSTTYKPYQGPASYQGGPPPAYQPTTPSQKKPGHGRKGKAPKDDSDSSESEAVWSDGGHSSGTPSTKPSSDSKQGRGRSTNRKKEPESRHGSPGRRHGKQQDKPLIRQDEVDKIVQKQVAEQLKAQRDEDERQRKEQEQRDKEARRDREVQDLRREVAALRAWDRRDDHDRWDEHGHGGRGRRGGGGYYN